MTDQPIADMSADELRRIAEKLRMCTGDKSAQQMAVRCLEIADLLDAISARRLEQDKSP